MAAPRLHAATSRSRRIVGGSRFGCEQESFVVDAERSDTRGRRGRDDVRRIEASAGADLDDAVVGGNAREGEAGGGGGDLEKARLKVGRFENGRASCRERVCQYV